MLLFVGQFQNCGSPEGGSSAFNSTGSGAPPGTGTTFFSFTAEEMVFPAYDQNLVILGLCGFSAGYLIEWSIKNNGGTLLANGISNCANGAFRVEGPSLSGFRNQITQDEVRVFATVRDTGTGAQRASGQIKINITSNSSILNAQAAVNAVKGALSGWNHTNVAQCAMGNAAVPSALLNTIVQANSSQGGRWGYVHYTDFANNLSYTTGDRVAYYYGTGTANGATANFWVFDFVAKCGCSEPDCNGLELNPGAMNPVQVANPGLNATEAWSAGGS